MADINISITNSTAGTVTASVADKITWTNNTGADIDSFTLPTCVAPQTDPAPISPGQTTIEYNVTGKPNTSYNYSYDIDDPDADTGSGTIDVS
jgi:hypothetical protein